MNSIKVSVIIPVYNIENWIDDCLISLINQTLKEIEIIIINDCSTDNSLNTLQKYSIEDNRITIITNKKNVGLGESRNIGIKKAKGEYIAFVDGDDWAEINYLEKMYNYATSEKVDIVITNYYQHSKEGRRKEIQDFRFSSKIEVFKKILIGKIRWTAWGKLFKKDIFLYNKIWFSKYKVGEDMDTVYKAIFFAERIGLLNEYLFNYRFGREGCLTSFIKQEPLNSIINHIDILTNIKKFLQDNHVFNSCYNEYIILCVKALKMISKYKDKSNINSTIDCNKYTNEICKLCDTGIVNIVNIISINSDLDEQERKRYIDYAKSLKNV